MCNWIQWDGSGRIRPHLDVNVHKVYYYREYISHAGFEEHDTNQLIFNFKKSIDAKEGELYYKDKAIKQFADELNYFLPSLDLPACITWIPSSKVKTDPKYDNRFERVAELVSSNNPDLSYIELFTAKESREPLHQGGVRKPEYIAANIDMAPIDLTNFQTVIIIDDVLTTGASFVAVHDLIKNIYPEIFIVGAVWAITIDDPDNPPNPFPD